MGRLGQTAFRVKAPLVVPRSYGEWRRLQAVDTWGPVRLAEYADRQALVMARFAFNRSPFYRGFYSDRGFTLSDFDDPGVLSALPLMTKELLRENADLIATPEATSRNAARAVTSGSTGEPLALLRDRRVPARAYEWRLMTWWGVSPGSDVATIDRHYRTTAQARLQRALWWPARRFQMDTFDIDEQAVNRFVSQWRRVRPEYLTGYVGGVVALARILSGRGIALHSPRAIGVTAGPLMPAQRAEIERFFRAPAYDHYRTSEANWLAGECEAQDGLHLFQDIKRIELLRDGTAAAAEEEGEIVVTDLTNRVFPLIRYATGDVSASVAEPCRCGRPHPRIRPVRGRVIDFLSLPSGKMIVGGLTGTFAGMDDYVRQFQIYQAGDFSIEVRVILTDHPDARTLARERVERLRRNVGDEAVVTMREVERIAALKGKFRYVLSDAPRVPGTTPISAAADSS